MQTIQEKFKSALKCGTGKAYFILLEYPQVDFSKIIKKSLLKRMCYDGQCEGHRGVYYYKLIQVAPQKKALIKFVLKTLQKDHKDWYVLTQLYEIAALLATKDDHQLARKLIWERFKKEYAESDDWDGEGALLKIDGTKALVGLARLKGKILKDQPDQLEFGSLINEFNRIYPKLNGRKIIRRASLQNAFIKEYWERVQKNEGRRKRPKKKKKKIKYTYKKINKKIHTSSFFWVGNWGDALSKKVLYKLAVDLIKSSKPKIQERYLKVFAKRKFPLDLQILFDFVERKHQSPKRLIEPAVEALALFNSKKIRSYALKRLDKKKDILIYLPLLIRNYQPEDHLLLDSILQKKWNTEQIHNLNYIYRAIYKENEVKESMLPLKRLYDRLNCGICREGLLEIMFKNQVLTKGMLKEMKFDSDDRVRTLYKKYKKRIIV